MALKVFEQRTNGVNYDPSEVAAAADLAEPAAPSYSSAPMRFSVKAAVGGAEVDLVSPMSTCGSGCRKSMFMSQLDDAGGESGSEVVIVRFAKFGETELAGGTPLRWLVVMEDGDTLRGPLRQAEPTDYPAELSLGGRMVITIQLGDEEPMRLLSRTEPVLDGAVGGWPPYGMSLQLQNGPIEYFAEAELEDDSAQPVVLVLDNQVLLGAEPHPILSRAPEITEAVRGDDGITLQWTDTASVEATDPPITSYHVYRNQEPGDPSAWELVHRSPVSDLRWVDTDDYDGAVDYLIVHAARCPFDYDLE